MRDDRVRSMDVLMLKMSCLIGESGKKPRKTPALPTTSFSFALT
jgi:hypothetical protein